MINAPTEVEVEDSSEFTVRKSVFDNRHFGIRLANLIKNSNDGLVIGLECQPQAASNFLEGWQYYLDSYECSLSNVRISANSKDDPQDALFVIISELYRLLADQQESIKDSYKEKAAAALRSVSRVGLKAGAKTIDAGALHETVYRDDSHSLSEDVADATSSYLAERLDDALSSRERVAEFRAFLSTIPQLLGNDQPIVIIVDGLDSCAPDFIVSMLESIQQFFSAPKLAFVINLSRKKIKSIGRHLNGAGAATIEQLNKSFDVWARLPEVDALSREARAEFVTQCLDKMKLAGHKLTNEIFVQLAQYYDLNAVEIEHSLAFLAIIENTNLNDKSYGVIALAPYLAITKVKFPKVYARISAQTISLAEVESATKLSDLKYPGWSHISQPHPVRFCLHICFGDGSRALAADVSKLGVELFGAGDAINELVPILDFFRPA